MPHGGGFNCATSARSGWFRTTLAGGWLTGTGVAAACCQVSRYGRWRPVMRKIPIAAVAALALLTGAASAQTPATPSTPRPAAPGATTAPAAPRPVAQNPLTQEDVANIDGTGVYGNDDKKIGHVQTVLMEPQSKKIDRLLVSSGGVLGVGGHRVAIPVDRFTWDAEKGAFKVP